MVKWSQGSGRRKRSRLRPQDRGTALMYGPNHSWPLVYRVSPGLNQGKGHWSLGLHLALRAGLLALHPKEGGEEAAGLRDGEQGLRRKGNGEGQAGVLVLGRL